MNEYANSWIGKLSPVTLRNVRLKDYGMERYVCSKDSRDSHYGTYVRCVFSKDSHDGMHDGLYQKRIGQISETALKVWNPVQVSGRGVKPRQSWLTWMTIKWKYRKLELSKKAGDCKPTLLAGSEGRVQLFAFLKCSTRLHKLIPLSWTIW